MRRIALSLFFLLFLVSSSFALGDKYKDTVKKNLYIIHSKDSKYIWGAKGEELNGKLLVDCSGLIYHVLHISGLPYKRTTAFRIRHGMDGYIGKDIELDSVEELDLPFWTWKDTPKREFGHVGIFALGKDSGLMEVTHASSSKGKVVHHELYGVFKRDLSAIRRLEFGDKFTVKSGKSVIKLK